MAMPDPCSAHSDDFWNPRRSFLDPIPELEEAADLLNEAVDALCCDEIDLAASLIRDADMSEIATFTSTVNGPYLHWVHRFRPVGDAPRNDLLVKGWTPDPVLAQEVFTRDGWRCRLCGIRIITAGSIEVLNHSLPDAARWGPKDIDQHYALRALCGSLDHVLPYSRGGKHEAENLVAACCGCQYGRSSWTLAEVGFEDPRDRAPIVDAWDGLSRLAR